MSAKAKTSLATLSFEEALKELESIVKSIESGNVPLDTAIEAYTRGMELQTHCRKKLEEAKLKVEKIALDHQGNISIEPFE
ncbi:MAG: exodeoxyribonuclease VII small subunit [Alphaproteobacteria bacterium]|nr:exodeoxyribonuclease VII small subunit [Alphaproteobacteria bacterium]